MTTKRSLILALERATAAEMWHWMYFQDYFAGNRRLRDEVLREASRLKEVERKHHGDRIDRDGTPYPDVLQELEALVSALDKNEWRLALEDFLKPLRESGASDAWGCPGRC